MPKIKKSSREKTKKKTVKEKDEILLGIDYGESRIGVAFGRKGLVAPIRIVSGKNVTTAMSEISRIALEHKVTKIVFGLPLNVEGKETPQSLEVRKFANLLKVRLKKPVEFIDEYRTSKDAVKSMIGLGFSRAVRRNHDHFSAAIILKDYFSENS